MTTHLRQYWHQLRESLWFIPGLMVLSSAGMAYGLVEFDMHTAWKGPKPFPFLFGSGAEGSRAMLTSIAGSMLTVAALTFSLTLSTITQVSSQYSPRVLRNFMRDRSNQFVMGYFVGVFTYCLLVLGTIRSTDEGKFVPATAVVAGLVLALGGVAALIFFIHHIAESMQTGTIVRYIFTETTGAINTLFPDQLGEPANTLPAADSLRLISEKAGWQPVYAGQTGYVQQIDSDGLLDWATDHRVVISIEQEIGVFVTESTVLFQVRPDDERPQRENDLPLDVSRNFVSVGRHRNIKQDVAFGIQQLVDIALKALSPGINDTTTAVMAVDYLGAITERLAQRQFPTTLRSDGQHIRVSVKAADFPAYSRLAFDLPRINARGNHAVLQRLLLAVSRVARATRSADCRATLREQAQLLMDYADQTLSTDYEKKQMQLLHEEMNLIW